MAEKQETSVFRSICPHLTCFSGSQGALRKKIQRGASKEEQNKSKLVGLVNSYGDFNTKLQ
jgi:hypothetical protein